MCKVCEEQVGFFNKDLPIIEEKGAVIHIWIYKQDVNWKYGAKDIINCDRCGGAMQ